MHVEYQYWQIATRENENARRILVPEMVKRSSKYLIVDQDGDIFFLICFTPIFSRRPLRPHRISFCGLPWVSVRNDPRTIPQLCAICVSVLNYPRTIGMQLSPNLSPKMGDKKLRAGSTPPLQNRSKKDQVYPRSA